MIENISGLIKQVDECIVNAYNKGYKDGCSEVICKVTEAIQKAIEEAEKRRKKQCLKCAGDKRMNDKEQIQLLKDAIEAYENGEILEAKGMAIEFINNITDFEMESEE